MSNGKLGSAVLSAGAYISPYIVPSTIAVATVNFNIVNKGTVTSKVRVAISTSNNPAPEDYIEYDISLAPGAVLERTGLALSTNEHICVYTDIAGPVIRVMGFEEVA